MRHLPRRPSHARGCGLFLQWLEKFKKGVSLESRETRLLLLMQYLWHFNTPNRINLKGKKVQSDLAKRTVLRTALSHIAYANDLLDLNYPWPVESTQVKRLCKSHFRKASKGATLRSPLLYEAQHVLQMVKAVEDHNLPYV